MLDALGVPIDGIRALSDIITIIITYTMLMVQVFFYAREPYEVIRDAYSEIICRYTMQPLQNSYI